MTVRVEMLADHLLALRASLWATRSRSEVDPPYLGVFNQLLASAQTLMPEGALTVQRQTQPVSAATLLMLVDQLLVAVDR